MGLKLENTKIIVMQMLFSFIMMAIGYACIKFKVISEDGRKSFANFISKAVLPCLVFTIIISSGSRSQLLGGWLMLVLTVCSFALQYIVAFFSAKMLKIKTKTFGIHIGLSTMGNNGFFGVPLFIALFGTAGNSISGGNGNAGMLALSLYFLVDQIYVWTLGYYNLSGRKGSGFKFKRLLTPALIALVTGLVIVLVQFDIQAYYPSRFLYDAIDGLGATSKYISLIYIGSCLPQIKIKSIFKNKNLFFVLSTKMLILPVVINLLMRLIPAVTAEQSMVITLTAAMPAMLSLPALVQNAGSDYEYALEGSLSSNILCLLTLPLIMIITSL